MKDEIKYKTIIKDNYCSIISKIVKNGFTDIDVFIDGLSDNFISSLEGLYHVMEEHAKNGGKLLTGKNIHKAYSGKNISIYEYRKGRLRIYWFYDEIEKNIVICSHGVIKHTQKTAKPDIEKAIKAYNQYHLNRESVVIL